jgi:tetratricopeptide (TPR) repeat protein
MRIFSFHIVFFLFWVSVCTAQKVSNNVQACVYYNNGISFLKERNYEYAIEEFREALALDKNNLQINTDYSFAYYLNKQYGNASIIIDETMKLPSADEKVFKLACEIYSAKNDYKTALECIELGMEKFPISGELVSQKAQLFYNYKKDEEAIRLWQMALDMQPGFAEPYYGIAVAYDTAGAYLAKTILYAETFLLSEPYSNKATEMKKLLYRCYQALYVQLFTKNNEPKATAKKSNQFTAEIENKLIRMIRANKYILIDGATIHNITQLRKSCIADWQSTQAEGTMPAVIEYHQRLVHEQLFDTYNEWLFGNVANAKQYKQWAEEHEDALDLFHQFLKENKFKVQ